MVVLTNSTPGREAEFNDWYDSVHLAQVCEIEGFKTARRMPLAAMMSEGVRYASVAIYDIETDDLRGALAEMQRLSGTDKLIVSDALAEEVYAGVYEVPAA
jgi:hypothetical protein